MNKEIESLVFLDEDQIDKNEYIIATYELRGKGSLESLAWNLAIGQSIGNPSVRNEWETDSLIIDYCAKIIDVDVKAEYFWEGKLSSYGVVKIAFPLRNLNWVEDGVSQLMCQLMGGQTDIDVILGCKLTNLEFPEGYEYFHKPKYGMTGVREFTGVYDKPLLGAIVKPKIGLNSDQLLDMVKQLVEGGVNFIKEDEIMSNPAVCPIEERVPKIMEYLKDKNVVYAVCINADPPYLLERVKQVHRLGGNAVHVNFWSGLGSYKAIRELDLPIFIHFQKSGIKVWSGDLNRYSIDWKVICQLAGMMGVDFIHAGMWGGYSSDDADELQAVVDTLHKYNVVPAFSCGMHPGLVNKVTEKFGNDYMANVGGSIHGHPDGSRAGALAMRHAIDQDFDSDEYKKAIEKYGLVK